MQVIFPIVSGPFIAPLKPKNIPVLDLEEVEKI
jgi:hypothetical protein